MRAKLMLGEKIGLIKHVNCYCVKILRLSPYGIIH
jgi:hypothetical protein